MMLPAVVVTLILSLVATGCIGRARPVARGTGAGGNNTSGGASNYRGSGFTGSSTNGFGASYNSNLTAAVAPGFEPAEPTELAGDPAAKPEETAEVAEEAGTGEDWPFWRGPRYDGVSLETGLIDDFDPDGGEGSNVAWKNTEVTGRSTPIVMGGRLYTLTRNAEGTPEEGEKVICLDAKTGKVLWENKFNVWLSDVPDTRVGWSSVVGDPETGNVYALGVCGYFQCINGKTGETIWSVPMHERFGLLSTYGGRTNFPVICDDLVIISAVVIGWGDMAKPAHRFVAFNKKDGAVVWFNGTTPLPYDTTYSSPTLTVINGRKMLIFGSGDGAVWAIEPRTGKHIWNYDFSLRGLNVSPLIVGDKVYAGHSEENIKRGRAATMGAVVGLDATKTGNINRTGELWKVEELMMGKSSPVMVDGKLYCYDDRAKLHVIDAKSGETVGRRVALGTVMRSSPLYADGKIYAFAENGAWHIVEPGEKGAKVLKRGRLASGESVNASPIVAHGRIYLQTSMALYCLADPKKEPGIKEAPAEVKEAPLEDKKVATVQIVPADLLTTPGAYEVFTVRTFNKMGQLISENAEGVEFSSDNDAAQITAKGHFLVPTEEEHSAITVTAKVGDVTGIARVRIVPRLPWKFTFDELEEPPITWVGARYRHIIRDVDGNKAMVKITTIPKGTRSRAWFGPSDLKNYTIQADIKGGFGNNKLPDIGLIAQGYTCDLQGATQELQIRSWVPMLRMAKSTPFKWEKDKWYTMKFRAEVAGGKALLKAKLWPRDEKEPEAWTLEAVDASPNMQGSPGLYGSAKDAEIFLDNITVTENK